VWVVIDGALLGQGGENTGDAFSEALARYDRESNGNYIVSGLSVSALGLIAGVNTFSVRDGTGNIVGYKVDKLSSTRLTFTEDPDLEVVEAEPDTFTGSTGGTATIQLNRFPLESILEVVITREKTVSITRGGTSGGQDTLPDVSILSIQSITQGATTYVANTDYFLNGDKVDWSPGGSEPAPGSSYSITYRYLGAATPSSVNLQAGTFAVTGAVNGTLVLTDYRWKLPRIDRLCLDRQGVFSLVRGIPSRFTVLPPVVPGNLLSLATIEQRWGQTPVVSNDGIRAIPFDQLERMRSLIVDLFDLVAQERLKSDISSREPSSKRGVFVDPFLDDDLRSRPRADGVHRRWHPSAPDRANRLPGPDKQQSGLAPPIHRGDRAAASAANRQQPDQPLPSVRSHPCGRHAVALCRSLHGDRHHLDITSDAAGGDPPRQCSNLRGSADQRHTHRAAERVTAAGGVSPPHPRRVHHRWIRPG
jgi:hypothetical protein